ncbi:hypothetical protein GCM10027038_14430 [Arthrobacter bambusae]
MGWLRDSSGGAHWALDDRIDLSARYVDMAHIRASVRDYYRIGERASQGGERLKGGRVSGGAAGATVGPPLRRRRRYP